MEDSKRKPGRPATGRGEPVVVTIPKPLLRAVDQYRRNNFVDKRQEAIRDLIARGLERA